MIADFGTYLRVGLCAAVAFLINWLSMIFFNRVLELHDLLSQLITTAIMLIWQYAAVRPSSHLLAPVRAETPQQRCNQTAWLPIIRLGSA